MSETIMGISGLPGWHIDNAGAGLIVGSIQTSSIVNPLPIGTNMLGSVNIREERFGMVIDGSIWVTSSATTILQPKERQSFVVVPGSVSSNNLNSKIWLGVNSNIVPGKGLELTTNQIFGINNYIGSVTAITDFGSILVGYWEM